MKRSRVLGASLLATLAAAGWFALQDDPLSDEVEVAAAARRVPAADRSGAPRRAMAPAVVAEPTWPEPPSTRSPEPWPFDAAQARAWLAPAPPAVVAPSPPALAPTAAAATPSAPQAPAFPYTLIGRIEEGGEARVVLSGPLQTLGVKPLDVIDGQWRVDEIRAQSLTVTWLPGGQRQTLAFRAS